MTLALPVCGTSARATPQNAKNDVSGGLEAEGESSCAAHQMCSQARPEGRGSKDASLPRIRSKLTRACIFDHNVRAQCEPATSREATLARLEDKRKASRAKSEVKNAVATSG